MSLAEVVDALGQRLVDTLDPTVGVGDVEPALVSELPTVALSIIEADQELLGVGRSPLGPQVGALAITRTVDLADPRLRLGDETIDLVTADRLTFIVPNGPIVRVDGTDGPAFDAADIQVDDGTIAYAVVNDRPAGLQVAVDASLGRLRFGQALPPSGTLTTTFHIGQWEVISTRHTGNVVISVSAATGLQASILSRQIADELATPLAPFERLSAAAWLAAEPVVLSDGPAYRHAHHLNFTYESESPLVPTGGGIIRTVSVDQSVDGVTEIDTIPRLTNGANQ